MVRRAFPVNVCPFCLCLPQKRYGFFRADVLDYHLRAGCKGKLQISFYQTDFRLSGGTAYPVKFRRFSGVNAVICNHTGIFLMEADGLMKAFRLFHGFSHNRLIEQGNAVIGKACRSGFCQLFHIRQLRSRHSQCNVGAAFDMNARFPSSGKHIRESFLIIHRRLRVRHQHNFRKATPCRRRSAGGNVLLVGKTRLPEMHVSVRKAGGNQKTLGVNRFCFFYFNMLLCLRRSRFSLPDNPCDFPFRNLQVGPVKRILHRVNYSSVFYQKHFSVLRVVDADMSA